MKVVLYAGRLNYFYIAVPNTAKEDSLLTSPHTREKAARGVIPEAANMDLQ